EERASLEDPARLHVGEQDLAEGEAAVDERRRVDLEPECPLARSQGAGVPPPFGRCSGMAVHVLGKMENDVRGRDGLRIAARRAVPTARDPDEWRSGGRGRGSQQKATTTHGPNPPSTRLPSA